MKIISISGCVEAVIAYHVVNGCDCPSTVLTENASDVGLLDVTQTEGRNAGVPGHHCSVSLANQLLSAKTTGRGWFLPRTAITTMQEMECTVTFVWIPSHVETISVTRPMTWVKKQCKKCI